MVYKNGVVYQGEWWEDQRNGNGTITFLNGNQFNGGWTDNTPGKGVLTNKEGMTEEGYLEVRYSTKTKKDKII